MLGSSYIYIYLCMHAKAKIKWFNSWNIKILKNCFSLHFSHLLLITDVILSSFSSNLSIINRFCGYVLCTHTIFFFVCLIYTSACVYLKSVAVIFLKMSLFLEWNKKFTHINNNNKISYKFDMQKIYVCKRISDV